MGVTPEAQILTDHRQIERPAGAQVTYPRDKAGPQGTNVQNKANWRWTR
jgi:hypothetical protein